MTATQRIVSRTTAICICTLVLCWAFGLAPLPARAQAAAAPAVKYKIGQLDPAITESSGIVASRRHPGVFWTHDDSGNAPRIFAVKQDGTLLATYTIGAKNVDWEDIAIDDDGHLYIGDIGNNARRRDRGPAVYQIDEPDPSVPVPAGAPALRVKARYPLAYPADPFDAEALFVWQDHGYIVSKQRDAAVAQVLRFTLAAPKPVPQRMEAVADLALRTPVTAADMSADGKELMVLTVFGPNRYVVNGDPAKAATVPPRSVMFLHPNMEAATLVPDGVLATTERRDILLFDNAAFDGPRAGQGEPAKRIAIAAATMPITVDGALDDWTDPATRQALSSDPTDAPDAAAAKLWLAWRPGGLYVAARVPRGDPSALLTEWFGGDAIEIFVGRHAIDRPAEYGAGDDRCYIGFAPLPDKGRGAVVLKWPRRSSPPVDAQVAGQVNADGNYDVEAFLPATAIVAGDPLTTGRTLRLEVSLLARRPRGNWYLSAANEAGTWMSPLKWTIATLK
ncbi:MAG TPA: hypothetical protein VGN72_23055 [Tepidisphaeraceae bacterium]|nr:hypothetical protein [Tepidisphaeraceae bacterium]